MYASTRGSFFAIGVLVPHLAGCVYTCPRMWTLQSIEPAEAELTFRLLPGTLKTMGRAPGVDFVVDAALVSRVHCRFTISSANELELEDLGSTNGTVVNGKRVTKAMLSNGDQVAVGRVLFVVNSASGEVDDTPEPTWGL